MEYLPNFADGEASGHNETFVGTSGGVDVSRRLLRCKETSVLLVVVSRGVSWPSSVRYCHCLEEVGSLRGMLPVVKA